MIAITGAVILLLAGLWLWLRDSSLVAVKRVQVTGATGPDAAAIRAALVRSAHNMTTLDVHMDQLNTAVAPYPVVKRLEVDTHFPHGLTIRVVEEAPVGAITVGGHATAVAADGTLLQNVRVTASLPVIQVKVPPGGSRVTDTQSRAEVAVLAAAPPPLLAQTTQITTTSTHGLVLALRHGPSIYFGDSSRLDAKWAAAAAVLADSGSAGALYVDVTDPQRPAAGGAPGQAGSASTALGAGTSTTPSVPTSTTPSVPTSTTPSATVAAGQSSTVASPSSGASGLTTTTTPGG